MIFLKRWGIQFLASRCELALVRLSEDVRELHEVPPRDRDDWLIGLLTRQHKRIDDELKEYKSRLEQ